VHCEATTARLKRIKEVSSSGHERFLIERQDWPSTRQTMPLRGWFDHHLPRL